jgi:hypothetical protein
MKLTKKTLDVLKNFSTINSNFYAAGGPLIKTISPMQNILAESVIDQELPEFGIYDLSEFLSVLSLYEDPDLQFSADWVDISWPSKSGTSVRFHFASKRILTISDKSIDISDFTVSVDLPKTLLADTIRSGAVLQLSDIVLKSDGNRTTFGIVDKKDGNKNTHLTSIPDAPESVPYEIYFKRENLKMVADNYVLSVSPQGISKFTSDNIVYWVAMET